jgi:hypothetical protein
MPDVLISANKTRKARLLRKNVPIDKHVINVGKPQRLKAALP